MSNNYGVIDGGRFLFTVSKDEVIRMSDLKEEFETVELSFALGNYLSEVMWEHHEMKQDKSNMFSKLCALIEVVEKTELDKDILIACINACGIDEK